MGKNRAGVTSEMARQIVRSGTPDVPKVDDTRLHDMLSLSDRKALNTIGAVDIFPDAGMPIFHEGDHAGYLYTIASGIVRICRHHENGDRQILAFLWPGDIFGLTDEEGLYVNSASTVSPAKTHRFPLKQLDAALQDNPRLQYRFLVKVNHDLRAAQRQIITLGHVDTYHRLSSFLVEMIQHTASSEPDSLRLRLPMARSDIADYLGTTQETISRGFKRLEREGIVKRLSPRSLEIVDVFRLLRLGRR